ncbi:MAG: hypothetical protein CFE34_18505 [Rhodobacteraceae bacterium PARR1]|nr:MAG: hypothetical protein CFE34_18505 [Rhodobacteraceae bacterium PARR1]
MAGLFALLWQMLRGAESPRRGLGLPCRPCNAASAKSSLRGAAQEYNQSGKRPEISLRAEP